MPVFYTSLYIWWFGAVASDVQTKAGSFMILDSFQQTLNTIDLERSE